MNKKTIIAILIVFTGVALALHLFKMHSVPPGFNADEAAYGYNAYSLLQTGKDEYGIPFPLRLISFGDYKLPGYSYLLMPFIALFGLSPWVVRLPALLAALGLIWVVYALAVSLTKNKYIGLIAAGLVALSPGIHILARHAHETIPATFLVLFALWCISRLIDKPKHTLLYAAGAAITLLGSMYLYHSARVYAVGLFVALCFVLWKNKTQWQVWLVTGIIFIAGFIPSLIADTTMPPARIATLFIGNSEGITLLHNELKTEFAHSPFSLRFFVLGWEILRRYVSYFSPEFLIYNGDQNPRFGYASMSILSLSTFIFILTGFFALFSRTIKNKMLYLLLYALCIAPIPAALTWQEFSLNRAYLLIPLLLIVAAMGISYLWNKRGSAWKFAVIILLCAELLFTARTWEFYFYHYPMRAIVIRSWEAGFQQLAAYMQQNKNSYKKIIVAAKDGQPYMHLLFWDKVPPNEFQGKAARTGADQYGFTQVTGFGPYIFNDALPNRLNKNEKVLLVLSDSQAKTFTSPKGITAREVQRITKGTETLFVLYELSAT